MERYGQQKLASEPLETFLVANLRVRRQDTLSIGHRYRPLALSF